MKTLLKHKHIYDFYIKTGEIVNFHPEIRKQVVDAFKLENPHYHYNDRCTACIHEMLGDVYRWYNQKMTL